MMLIMGLPTLLPAQVKVEVQKTPFQVTLQGTFQGFQQFALAQPP